MKYALIFAAVLAVSAAQPPVNFGNLNRLPTRPPPPFKPVTSRPPYRPLPFYTPEVIKPVASSDQAANVISYKNEINPDGSYIYNVKIDNGITAEAQGTPRDFGGNPPVVAVVSQGSFSWTSPEGQLIVITYTANENGYQPSGDAIPTPPPVSDLSRSINRPLQNRLLQNKPLQNRPLQNRLLQIRPLQNSQNRVVNEKPKPM